MSGLPLNNHSSSNSSNAGGNDVEDPAPPRARMKSKGKEKARDDFPDNNNGNLEETNGLITSLPVRSILKRPQDCRTRQLISEKTISGPASSQPRLNPPSHRRTSFNKPSPLKRRKINPTVAYNPQSSPATSISSHWSTDRTPSPECSGGATGNRNGRHYSVYEAVAGRVRTAEPIPFSERQTLYSTRSSVLSADKVLFRRKRAPIRYAEHDIYLQHLLLPSNILPSSDLLKCLHAFTADFTHGKALAHQHRRQPYSDEKDRKFTFWDQMNEVLYGVSPPVSPPPDADPEYLRWHAARRDKQTRRERYERRKEELQKLMQEIDALGPVPDDEEGRLRWERERHALLSTRGLGKVDLEAAARDPDKAREALKAIRVRAKQEEELLSVNRGKRQDANSITRFNTLMNRGDISMAGPSSSAKSTTRPHRLISRKAGVRPRRHIFGPKPRSRDRSSRSKSPKSRLRRSRMLFDHSLRAHRSFDGSALLALGILAEELCHSSLGRRGHRVLTEGLAVGPGGEERYVGHGRGGYKHLWKRRGPAPGFREKGKDLATGGEVELKDEGLGDDGWGWESGRSGEEDMAGGGRGTGVGGRDDKEGHAA